MASDPCGRDQNYFAILGDAPPPKRKTPNLNNNHDFPQLKKTKATNLNPSTSPKYLVMKNKENKPLKNFNVFLIQKALESITTEAPIKINFNREGDLIILTKNSQQTTKFLKATQLSSLCPISVTLHPTLNTIKGVIYSNFLTNLSESEIVDGLRQQGATECKKVTKVKEGKVVNTPLHIISFDLYDLPKEVNIAWMKVKVEPYIPSPMQCKNCYLIGHTAKHCKSEQKCNICSTAVHIPTPCTKVECINCKHQHRSDNKNCPTFQKRKEILTYKTLNKCTFREATEEVNKSNTNYPTPVENLEEATQKTKSIPIVQKTTTTTNKEDQPNSTTGLPQHSTNNNIYSYALQKNTITNSTNLTQKENVNQENNSPTKPSSNSPLTLSNTLTKQYYPQITTIQRSADDYLTSPISTTLLQKTSSDNLSPNSSLDMET